MRCERIGDAELYLGDCMEYMATCEDKAFELAIVDPPYGIGVSEMNIGARVNRNLSCDNKAWDNTIPSEQYFNELQRVSKEQIVFGANYFNCFNGNHGAIVWNKNNPMPTQSDCEIASYSKHRKVAIYNQTWTNYVNTKSTNHPTEKPVDLYKWLLSRYAKPGDKILDTHGGSGSSVVACIEMGFPIVWIEKDPDYFEAALDRIRRAWQNRPRLFEDNTPPTQGELL